MESLLPLIAFAVVATLTPGGATTLATASGAHFGFRRSVPVMAGCASGLGTVAAAAAAGLAGVLLAVPSLQWGMRAAGSLYLVWLAWRIARSGPPRLRDQSGRPGRFFAGVAMLWYNPKGWAMAVSAASSFTPLASGPVRLALLLGVTFCAAAGLSLALWCVAGQILARRLRTDRQWHILNAVLGVLLAASIVPMWF
jgi:threonine/homoserine/homoserine lactone efflux protein